jgi:uncharacterized membrane protein
MSYQSQAQVIAWIKMVGSAVILILLLFGTALLLSGFPTDAGVEDEMDRRDPDWRQKMEIFTEASPLKKLLILAPSYMYFIGEIVLAVYLLKAAGKLNYKKLRLWYVVTATYCTIMVVLFGPVLLYSRMQSQVVIMFIGTFFFTLYSLFVVHKLRNEIKTNTLPRVQFHQHPLPPFDAPPDYPYPANEKQFMKI